MCNALRALTHAPHTRSQPHSCRKAGASILSAMNVGDIALKRWGGWRSTESAAKYPEENYDLTEPVQRLFDHKLPRARAL